MDAKEQLKEDVHAGKVGIDRLIDMLFDSHRKIQELLEENAELKKQIASSPTPKVDEAYSMKAEEKRQEAKNPKKKRKPKKGKKRGRITSAEKIALAERTEAVYPEGLDKNQCHLSHTRPLWRLENGRAVLIAYQVYRGPNNRYGQIPGAVGRSEFGLEIFIEIAFLVYNLGLSFDKVCLALQFFQNLNLRKSQVDALLHRLSRDWEKEFETLCTLVANSLVVWTDETGWSLKSVWAFLSEKARILLFGVNKDAETLKKILDPATFKGLVISDHAAVYGNFTHSQKCWAHLLRKAIKLTLLEPDNAEYRHFADRLIEIYRKAVRVKGDGRLGEAGRLKKIADLEGELVVLCSPLWSQNLPKLAGTRDDYRKLNNEIMELVMKEELFAFVTAEEVKQPNGVTVEVGATNNESERTLRKPAEARKTGRTSKSMFGARRQSILTSVLESLRLYLKQFTLANVIEEIERWTAEGLSCFTKLLKKMKLALPEVSVLDRLFAQVQAEPELEGTG